MLTNDIILCFNIGELQNQSPMKTIQTILKFVVVIIMTALLLSCTTAQAMTLAIESDTPKEFTMTMSFEEFSELPLEFSGSIQVFGDWNGVPSQRSVELTPGSTPHALAKAIIGKKPANPAYFYLLFLHTDNRYYMVELEHEARPRPTFNVGITNGELILKSEEFNPDDVVRIRITDSSGRTVFINENHPFSSPVATDDWPVGVYTVNLWSDSFARGSGKNVFIYR